MSNLPEYMKELVEKVEAEIHEGIESAKMLMRDLGVELSDEQIKDSFRSDYIRVIGYLNRVSDMNKTDEQRAKIIAYGRVKNALGISL